MIGSIGSIGLNRLSCFEECSSINTFYSYLNSVSPSNANSRSIALEETIVGAKIGGIAGEQPSVTKVSYFKGNDKSKWQTNIPTFNTVNLGEVCEGIGLSLKAYGDNVEKLFCVKPGASPAFIKVQIDCGKSLRVNQEGQLEADTELGPVKFTRPIAYQEIEGKSVEVAAGYKYHGALDTSHNGSYDAFVTRMDNSLFILHTSGGGCTSNVLSSFGIRYSFHAVGYGCYTQKGGDARSQAPASFCFREENNGKFQQR